jgi:hypothetical protein
MKKYLFNIAIAADNTLNALLGGNPCEVMSARVYREKRYKLISVIAPTYTNASNVTSFVTPQVTSEGFSVPVTGTNFTNTSWTVSASCSAHIS